MTESVTSRLSFLSDESGSGAVEYSLIIALVALVISFSAGGLGVSLKNLFDPSTNEVEDVARCVEVGSNCKKNK